MTRSVGTSTTSVEENLRSARIVRPPANASIAVGTRDLRPSCVRSSTTPRDRTWLGRSAPRRMHEASFGRSRVNFGRRAGPLGPSRRPVRRARPRLACRPSARGGASPAVARTGGAPAGGSADGCSGRRSRPPRRSPPRAPPRGRAPPAPDAAWSGADRAGGRTGVRTLKGPASRASPPGSACRASGTRPRRSHPFSTLSSSGRSSRPDSMPPYSRRQRQGAASPGRPRTDGGARLAADLPDGGGHPTAPTSQHPHLPELRDDPPRPEPLAGHTRSTRTGLNTYLGADPGSGVRPPREMSERAPPSAAWSPRPRHGWRRTNAGSSQSATPRMEDDFARPVPPRTDR